MLSCRVLLVEDHPLLQRAMQALLNQYCEVVGVADRAEGLLSTVYALQPHAVILDVSLPGKSGLQVLPELRCEFPEVAVVIATVRDYPEYRRESLERGAHAFLSKSRLSEELWPVIETICAGCRDAGRV